MTRPRMDPEVLHAPTLADHPHRARQMRVRTQHAALALPAAAPRSRVPPAHHSRAPPRPETKSRVGVLELEGHPEARLRAACVHPGETPALEDRSRMAAWRDEVALRQIEHDVVPDEPVDRPEGLHAELVH